MRKRSEEATQRINTLQGWRGVGGGVIIRLTLEEDRMSAGHGRLFFFFALQQRFLRVRALLWEGKGETRVVPCTFWEGGGGGGTCWYAKLCQWI